MSDTIIPKDLHDEPCAVKLVYIALAAEGPITRREVAEQVGIRADNLDRYFSRLSDAGLLDARPDWKDNRRHTYEIDTEEGVLGGSD